MDDHPLWQYFRDVNRAVQAANQGEGAQPYVRGTFMVSAYADDLELSVTDVSEEDAVLIAAELQEMGVRAVIRSSFVCPHCGLRVPQQDYCVSCRKRLPRIQEPDADPNT